MHKDTKHKYKYKYIGRQNICCKIFDFKKKYSAIEMYRNTKHKYLYKYTGPAKYLQQNIWLQKEIGLEMYENSKHKQKYKYVGPQDILCKIFDFSKFNLSWIYCNVNGRNYRE